MRKLLAFLLMACCAVTANDVVSLIAKGDAAAHADRHQEAIEAYLAAIRLDPGVRSALLPKLGRQYLWSDQAALAAPLLGEYLQAHPADCDIRMNWALALSWANQLRAARKAYAEVPRHCPELATQAALSQARVLRWMDRPSRADRLYQSVMETGKPVDVQDARLGLALNQLSRDNNRAARQMFQQVIASGSHDSGAFLGEATADLHMGRPDEAQNDLHAAAQNGIRDRGLSELDDFISRLDRPSIAPAVAGFHDADGTNYWMTQMSGGFGWNMQGRGTVFGGTSRLQSLGNTIDGHWGGITLDQRFNESWAMHGEGRYTQYDGAGFHPFTGELDGVWTPADHTRVDLAMAKIVIADNAASLLHHLTGAFFSGGIDQRITNLNTISAAVDGTHWSETNNRLRYRLSLSHRFEGVPRLTISLPTLYQTYNQGFNFGLFSPTSYIETGPAAEVSFRRAKHWVFDLYGRAGGQKEAALSWKPLAQTRAQVERELYGGWGLQAMFWHSTSNLASPTGFKRTLLSFSLTKRF